MKAVIFTADSGMELKIEPDFSEAQAGEAGKVRVQLSGPDVDTQEEVFDAKLYDFFTPGEAREIARYFNEMADRAEQGQS